KGNEMSTHTRVHGDVLLVGSMPFDDVEQVFRAAGQGLRGHVGSLPDGEVRERKNWVGMLPELVFASHPQLEVVRAPSGQLEQPEQQDDAPPAEELEGFWTFRIKPGERFRIDDLHYGRFARDSYEVFTRLRDDGAVE